MTNEYYVLFELIQWVMSMMLYFSSFSEYWVLCYISVDSVSNEYYVILELIQWVMNSMLYLSWFSE